MSNRMATLQELGLTVGLTAPPDAGYMGVLGPALEAVEFPALSGYAEFTPIKVRSSTTMRINHAHVESN